MCLTSCPPSVNHTIGDIAYITAKTAYQQFICVCACLWGWLVSAFAVELCLGIFWGGNHCICARHKCTTVLRSFTVVCFGSCVSASSLFLCFSVCGLVCAVLLFSHAPSYFCSVYTSGWMSSAVTERCTLIRLWVCPLMFICTAFLSLLTSCLYPSLMVSLEKLHILTESAHFSNFIFFVFSFLFLKANLEQWHFAAQRSLLLWFVKQNCSNILCWQRYCVVPQPLLW